MKPLLMIMGSDKDQARLIPLYKTCEQHHCPLLLSTISSGNHAAHHLLTHFSVHPDHNVSCKTDELALLSATIMQNVSLLIAEQKPSHVIVAGDSVSTFASALAAHYQGVPVVHIPVKTASIRTKQHSSEYDYVQSLHNLIAYHCAPTQAAAAQLLAQGIHRNNIGICGNLQADLVLNLVAAMQSLEVSVSQSLEDHCAFARIQKCKTVVVMLEDHEQYKEFYEQLVPMLKSVVTTNKHIMIIVITQSAAAQSALFDYENDHLVAVTSTSYYDRLFALSRADIVMTNMHDVHEDALCLAKPVIMLQPYSYHPETIWAGYTHVVDTDLARAQALITTLVQQPPTYDLKKLFGQGKAAEHVMRSLQPLLG